MQAKRRALFTLVIIILGACTAERQVAAPSASAGPSGTAPIAASEAVATARAAGEVSQPTVQLGWSGTLDTAVTSFGAAHLDGYLYVLGGYHGTPHRYHREAQSGAFLRRPLAGGSWESLASPGAVQSVSLLPHGGKLYRVGGMQIRNAEHEAPQLHSVATFAVFDPATQRWSELPALPRGRSSHAAVVLDGRLFVVGGWTMSGGMNSGVWDSTLLQIDLSNPEEGWQQAQSPVKTRALGLVASGTRLFAIGGMTPERVSDAVHIYDTTTNTWSRGPDFPEGGFGLRAAVLRGRIYASASSGAVYRLDENASSWQRVGQLMFPRFFHAAVSVDAEQVLFLGGIAPQAGVGRIRPIETLTVGPANLEPRVEHWTLPAPYPAKNRQGLFVHGTQLYSFGGNGSLGQHDFAPENFLEGAARLDLGALQWHTLPPFPRRRQSMQTLVTESGRGLAVGGFGIEEGQQRTQSEAFWFDFDTERWSSAGWKLPEARTQFGLVEARDALWVFGGLEFDSSRGPEEQFGHPRAVLRLDWAAPDQGFVDSGVNLPRARRAFAGASLDERYYLIGGMAAGFGLVDACDVFDFESRSWETIAPPRRTRIGAELVALNGKLYLIAGRSRQGGERLQEDKSIEVYDPATNRWSVWLETIPMDDTHHLRAMALNGRIVLYSAQREDGQVRLVVLDPS